MAFGQRESVIEERFKRDVFKVTAGLEKEAIVTGSRPNPWRLWNSDRFPSIPPL